MITNNFNAYLVEAKNHETFRKIQKMKLNDLEKFGLGHALVQFVKEYEEENFGEFFSTNIKDFIQWHTSSVDILDGYQDTYFFHFEGLYLAINYIWVTNNGIIMLNCYEADKNTNEINYDSDILLRLN